MGNNRRFIAGLALALGLCFAAPASAQRARTPLPAVAKTKAAKKNRDKRIESYRQHYLKKKAEGRVGVLSPKKAKAEKEIRDLALKLNAALKAKPATKPILIVLEGMDGAGKSSTIRRLLPAFEGARNVGVEHFGAPEAGTDADQQGMRYLQKVPVQGRVTSGDRSWYGPARYQDDGSIRPSVKGAKEAIRDVRHLEGLLKNKVEIVKIYLDIGKDRQAKTLGKREALKPEKLGDADYQAYRQHGEIRALDKQIRARTGKASPWHVVSMNDRAAGRKQMLQILHKTLIGE
mgnify:CR=1 FL=1